MATNKSKENKSKARASREDEAEAARKVAEADQGQVVKASASPDPGGDASPGAGSDASSAGEGDDRKGAPLLEPITGNPLTSEQRAKLRDASTDQIEGALADPLLPTLWRKEFTFELETRQRNRQRRDAKARLTSPLKKYEITKGGKYVVPGEGRITALHTGGVVCETTHDLKELKRQGIEFRELRGRVVVVNDLLGRTTTKIEREEAMPVEPTGEAPKPPEREPAAATAE